WGHSLHFLPPLRMAPVVRALNPAHNGRVCSTWGNFHYKTFDGDIFHFPGLCNYVLSAHCGAAYEDFNIQLRRGLESNATTVIRVTMKLDGMVIQLTKNAVLANGQLIQLPFSQSGVLIEHSSNSLKVVARLGLVFMWSQDDSLLLELDAKYANQTCGLCGDFNSEPVFNEFLSHGVKLTPIQFGNLQKMDGPTEQCQDPVPVPMMDCSPGSSICEEILSSRLFSGCSALVDASSYVQACRHDLCACEHANPSSCICHTLAEYSRQCAHAGGLPLDWRGPDLCPQTCPLNMQYRECGSPCADTCSNPEHSQLCEDHCMAGCFCPEGMVLDDIGQTGCIPASQCACVYNGATYAPGAVYSTDCTNCTCLRGQWSCQEVPCPGTCSVLGGAHFSTFDERRYTVHGDCSYVLVKPCNSSTFTVLAELRKCGLTDTETCLRSLTLSLGGGHTVITVKASGEVFVNQIYTQMPISAGNVTLFRPSTFFIIAQTNLGLQLDIQLVPIMQVFVRLGPELRGLTCGLCGNFNQNQADDFRALSGVVEGTAAAFANTWKTQATCPNVKNSFEDPCSLSVENGMWVLVTPGATEVPSGPKGGIQEVNRQTFQRINCMFDTCNCEKSEDCLCAALSSYVHACAANGVLLSGWRDSVCTKPMATCPKSLTYQYHIDTCQPTCRSRSHEDITCGINFVPVDGCTCPTGTFMDDTGKCVPPTSCPCYHGGSMVPNGESLHERGAICTCTQGMLTCIGGQVPTPVCTPPMVYLDCRNATPGATGAGCQKSCFTLDMDCVSPPHPRDPSRAPAECCVPCAPQYSSQCEPGCVCPDGLVSDGKGGCVAVTDCPCVHNEASYLPGQTIWVGCNTCTCKNRMWKCTDEPCLATCAVYGDGHYLTFDGRRYSFSGDCAYTLVQDHCGGNSTANATFRVVTENVPCGTTGVTCSKAIKLFLGSYELRLSGGSVEVIEKGAGQAAPYSIRQMGIYLVVDTEVGLVLLWDRKTSIFLKLSPEFKGRVCGLCGNFDDNAVNDFTTRSQSVVGSTLEFGNSWKFSPSCPDAPAPRDPCTANPYRKSWSQKQCSIINSATFAACHAHVEPAKYYEACVGDACACDSGGDCECFCTAVAAYAQACHDVGVCVSWRTPDICPLFCDYYNPEGQCEWHYQPCGVPCMRTCRNPSGRCLHDLHGLEGCYPKCPPEAPIFDEDQMQCVATCPTPPPPLPCRVQGKSYWPGSAVPSEENCQSCVCTESGVQCVYDAEACVCTYDGSHFHLGDVIYHTTDGTGGCISARCSVNGTIERKVYTCSSTTPAPPTTFSFSTPSLGVSSIHPPRTCHRSTKSTVHTNTPSSALSSTLVTASSPMSHKTSVQPHVTCGEECLWSPWLDVSHPGRGIDSGDFDTLENLRAHGYHVCSVPKEVECQAEGAPEVPLQVLGQHVECSPTVGLVCYNRNQTSGLCYNYQIRILCCFPGTCSTSSTTTLAPSTPTPLLVTSTIIPSTFTLALSTPLSVPVTTVTIPGTPTHVPGTTTTTTGTPTPTQSATTTTLGSPTTVKNTTFTLRSTPASTTPAPCLQNLCSWTHWLDGSYPEPGINGGDFDTFPNLRATGYKFCEKPSNVECRAAFFPNIPLDELGQDVICDKSVGLMCLNKNQFPPICYNYEIRIQCCELVDVCTSTTSPVTAENTHTTPRTTQTHTQLTSTTGIPLSPTQHSEVSSTQVHSSTSNVLSTNLVSVPTTINCQPRCTWTKWFDVDFPSPGPHGGDVESFSNIMRRGEKICRRPEYITQLECRAESHPEVSIDKLGQVVQCNLTKGLVCRNQDQKGNVGMCLNYEVRVLCCETPEGCPHTKTVTVSHTPSVTSPKSVSTTTSTSMPTTGRTSGPETSSTSVPTTAPTSVVSTTTSTSMPTTGRTSGPETSSTSVPTTAPTSVPTTSSTSVPPSSPTSVPKTSSTSGPTTGPTTVPTTSSTTVPTTGPTSVSSTSGPTTGPTTVPTTSSTTVPTTGPNSVPTTSSTSVPPSSPTSVPEPSSTSGPTTGSTTVPTTATTSVPTTAPTSVPTTSSTSVPTSSPTTVPTTSSTSVPPSSPTSVPKTSSTSGPTTGPTTVPTTSSTSVPTTGPTTVPTTSSTTVPTTGPTSVPTKSSTSVPPSSPTFVPESSSTSGPTTGPTTVPTTSSTTVPTTGPNSVPTTSSTSVPPSSPTSVPEPSSTSVSTTAPRSVPATSSTPIATTVPTTSLTSLPASSPTSLPKTTTMSAPTTSTIPVLTSETTHSPYVTVTCQPQCTWTKWFDVDFPSPGPHGGDAETFCNIKKRGEKICRRPEYIAQLECRAESHPEVSIDKLGQVVQCNVTKGLVCRNRDQKGNVGMCLNYEVRVLCCETPEGSASVPTTSATTVPTTSLTSLPASSPTSLPKTTTMSAPTTSTIPVLTSETTHSPYVTVTCQPQCTWTKWFDVDFPSPGPHGGDAETFCNIKKRGEKICRRPEYIAQLECRAESHPEVSIDKLGQVVQCNVTKGLVCRNRDQKGNVGMCLNYEVRVLCCEPPEHCGHTSVTPHVTSSTNRSPPPEFTSVVSTVSFPSSVAPSTTTCYCSVSGKLYPAGSIIYQQTDLAGHCYYAMCSLDCQVVRWSDQSCSSSVPPPAPTTSPPGPSLSASVPVTMHGCPNAIPPRMKGETWPMPNCSQATCQGNGVITVHPRSCPQTQPPTCTNGFPPVKVTDHDDCCPNYQCQCVCSGWGDPHYITFDGTYYSFLDNCTYVLVQQIVPVYGHFRVLINNYFCGAEDGLSCPQSIIVEYQQARVVMTRKPILGVMTNEIIFNDQVVRPGFQKDGVSVSQIGIKMYVTIPKLGVQVMFSGLIFSVEVPFSKFANNTEGQCGTCSNDKRDECRLPGGVEVASCSAMSSHWRVTTPDQPYCYGPLPTPTAAWPTPSPSSCPPAPVCHLILSKVFGPCHAVIPPLAFYEGCVFDHCHKTDSNVMCSALELYASLCASRGVCIDWRSHTNHTCPFTCPADKVYQPCGPSKPSYCYGSDNTSLMALQDSGPITEGCFCPEGMKFFSRSSEVCVPIDCHTWPHVPPLQPGHSITVDCQWCTCENHTLTMSCQRQPCPLPPACPLPGFVPVPAAPQAGQCCPQYNCACDTSYCPKPVACPEGSRPILTYEEGACCPSQNCSWSVCNVNGTLYQPGSVVSSSLCETCRCEAPDGPHSDTVIISCETQICNTHCPVGFEYQPQSGQCCGLCVQQACVVNSSNNSTHLFYPGQSWPDPGNPCMTHECEKHQDGLVVVTTKKACPPLSCPEEQALPSKDGCCLSCPLHPPHTMYHEQQVISQQGCSSPGPVHLAYCQGNCGDSSSRYSLETKAMKHTCQCCQELRVSLRNVTLHCADGSSWVFSYPQVEECGCVGQHCGSEESRPEQSGEEQSEEIERTGWRRRPRTTGSPSRLTRTRPRGSRPPSSGIQG
uniref:Mucin 5AC, oligomeric mucus/gel-forming n=1 Tax=Canis lupus familiaris TaxID=9615 RepID=A0A8C0TL39_CANLF